MSERIADLTIGGFGEALSSKAPVPGGGGASSVAAAVGCSLGRMVASLTVGKKRYADVEARVREIAERLDALRDELLALADDDAEAFEPLSRAYGLPKTTDAERAPQGRGHGGGAQARLRAADGHPRQNRRG